MIRKYKKLIDDGFHMTFAVFYLDIHLDIWEFALILYQKLNPYFNPTGGAHKNGRENRNPWIQDRN